MTGSSPHSPTVLISGCSSGIGRAAALRMASRSWRVLAGVRTAQAAAELAAASPNITPIMLDVTRPADLASATELVTRLTAGRGLDALVNNAGICTAGPLELVPLEAWRTQLEVNVLGVVALTQAMLPLLRQAGARLATAGGMPAGAPATARIINISSISGRAALPMLGPYAASKFALGAITHALRQEVAPHHIRVCLLEPGSFDTAIWNKSTAAADALAAAADPAARAAYQPLITAVKTKIAHAAATARPLEPLIDHIERCLTVPRPPARIVVGTSSRITALAWSILPTAWTDWAIARQLR
jgi:NAD(P)-dependent dehydrogenase (short-subunit alcohol dehydrogenase family)